MTEAIKTELRELDARIARFMGWTDVEPNCNTPIGKEWCGDDPSGTGGFYRTGRKIVPRFSVSIADAMEVVEKMRAQGCGVVINAPTQGVWCVGFGAARQGSASSESLSEAICKAALATLESEKK